jgi:hypothetical protein
MEKIVSSLDKEAELAKSKINGALKNVGMREKIAREQLETDLDQLKSRIHSIKHAGTPLSINNIETFTDYSVLHIIGASFVALLMSGDAIYKTKSEVYV